MKVSRQQVDDNRRAILTVAGRLFRSHGFDAVSLSDVMKAAGLTHGAFYGYFRSKDELVAATLQELARDDRPPGPWAQSVARYLCAGHRDDVAGGCPVAALATEVARQGGDARAALTENVRRMIAEAAASPGAAADPRQAGVAAVATMVGALILSRAVDDAPLSEELLTAARAAIGEGASGG